nr:hypothetical protein [Allomuricauda sp.]
MAGEKQINGDLRMHANGKKIFDATGCTLSLTRETTQTTGTKDTAAGSQSKGTKGWTASYSGLAIYAGDAADANRFEELFDMWNDDDQANLVHIEFVPSESDYTYYYEGDGIITQLDGVFNFSEKGTITMTVTGSGPISKVDKNTTAPGS